MTICAVCDAEIELDVGEEPTMAECGLHEAHADCVIPGVGCLICDPPPELPVTTPTPEAHTHDVHDASDGVPDADGDVFYDAEEGTPEEWAAAGLPDGSGANVAATATADPIADPTADGTTAAADAPDPERVAHLAAAARIAGDVARARTARERASTAIAALVDQGVTNEAVLGVMDTTVLGYSTSYGVCAADDLAGYEAMQSWPVNTETTTYVNATCDSYVAHAGVLENTAALDAIRVVDIGTGFRQRLTATGGQNVADMALGGEDYTGHNLHDLTDDLKGWASIRAEVGKIILVRWAGEKWEVGATGAHTNDNDYKLDATIASAFAPTLAYRVAGVPTLG